MRIEIQMANDEPMVYPLRGSKLIIGSGEAANIQLPQEAGISRKHLQISIEGDSFYVTDMGSTNGTFINEERLVPGSKKEFTSFFPVKLGDNVSISLLSDDEGLSPGVTLQEPINLTPPAKKESSGTKNLIDFGNDTSKTKTIVTKREHSTPVKAKSAPKNPQKKGPTDSSRMKITGTVTICLLGFAYVYNFHISPPDSIVPQEVVAPKKPREMTPKEAAKTLPQGPQKIPEKEFPSEEDIARAFTDLRCATTLEKKLCEMIPEARPSPGGASESIGKVIVLLPEEKWLDESFKQFIGNNGKSYLKPELQTAYMAILFFHALPEFNWEEQEKNLFFVFYRMQEERPNVSSIIGIKPKELAQMRKLLVPEAFAKIPQERIGWLIPYTEYFSVIKASQVSAPTPPPPPTAAELEKKKEETFSWGPPPAKDNASGKPSSP